MSDIAGDLQGLIGHDRFVGWIWGKQVAARAGLEIAELRAEKERLAAQIEGLTKENAELRNEVAGDNLGHLRRPKAAEAEVERLKADALRWYRADGTFEVLSSAEEVVERRKAAADLIEHLKISEAGWMKECREARAEVERLTRELAEAVDRAKVAEKDFHDLYNFSHPTDPSLSPVIDELAAIADLLAEKGDDLCVRVQGQAEQLRVLQAASQPAPPTLGRKPSEEWLSKAAEAEDAHPSISVGGLAVELGMLSSSQPAPSAPLAEGERERLVTIAREAYEAAHPDAYGPEAGYRSIVEAVVAASVAPKSPAPLGEFRHAYDPEDGWYKHRIYRGDEVVVNIVPDGEDGATCARRIVAALNATAPPAPLAERPEVKGASRAVAARKDSRLIGPGKQVLSAGAAAELAAVEAGRNSPENRARIRLEELPPADDPAPPATAEVDPSTPRRFRWPKPGGGGWHWGVWWPRPHAERPNAGRWTSDCGDFDTGPPGMDGLEWLDPAPAWAVTAGGVTLPSETDGESAAAKLLARVAAIQAVEADRPIRLAAGDDPHGGPVS